MIKRDIFHSVKIRLQEPRRYMQALVGPRQVGKTTLALQVAEALHLPFHYATADEPGLQASAWLEQQWEVARLKTSNHHEGALLVLDEIQKISEWSTIVKRLWDEDTRAKRQLKVILLGSAPLMIHKGLSESLAGRFEITPVRHWTFKEMHEGFQWDFEQYVYYGGYPGSASLIADETRWKRYIIDALIEPTISKDILSLEPVQKPALLKQLFYLGCLYSGQILSYQKMTGQLQDAGNTTTLAHYLSLLDTAGLLSGIGKFAGEMIRQRGSSPKFQVQNTALASAISALSFSAAREDREFWGHLLESAIGAYLVNEMVGKNISLHYWRDRNQEVDFVLQQENKIIGIEVKSGKSRPALPGIDAFRKAFHPYRILLVGGQGMKPETFLTTPIEDLFN